MAEERGEQTPAENFKHHDGRPGEGGDRQENRGADAAQRDCCVLLVATIVFSLSGRDERVDDYNRSGQQGKRDSQNT
jgi:hypothetical protein